MTSNNDFAPNTFQFMQPRDDEPSPVAVISLDFARNYREIISPIAARSLLFLSMNPLTEKR